MQQTLVIIQVIVSVSLIAVILIQAKGVGLGRAWGGGGEFYKSRRGVEKVIFRLTVVLVALFLASSIFGVIYL